MQPDPVALPAERKVSMGRECGQGGNTDWGSEGRGGESGEGDDGEGEETHCWFGEGRCLSGL